jgi:hypothetical protein
MWWMDEHVPVNNQLGLNKWNHTYGASGSKGKDKEIRVPLASKDLWGMNSSKTFLMKNSVKLFLFTPQINQAEVLIVLFIFLLTH